jgi:hypothetical protein
MPFQDRPLPANFEVSAIIQHKTKRTPPRKPKGAIAKITRDLKEGIIDAAVIVGSDGEGTGGLTGFLVDLALHHKKAYAGLLAKVLPLQISPHYNAGAMIGSVNFSSDRQPFQCGRTAADRTRARHDRRHAAARTARRAGALPGGAGRGRSNAGRAYGS